MFKPLKEGDKVAVVAPSGVIQPGALDAGIQMLESWGLNVKLGNHVYDQCGFFASTDANRLSDLQEALDDSGARGVIMARGGFGVGRILDNLKLEGAVNQRKCIVGFSDITLLHAGFQNAGLPTVHGPMVKQLGTSVDNASCAYLQQLIFGSIPEYRFSSSQMNRSGSCAGIVVGGNLSLVVNNIGTHSDLELSNKILFLEEIDEPIYAVDRMFNQLLRCGKLESLAGLLLGEFKETRQTVPHYHQTLEEVIRDYTHAFGYPVAFDFPAGHGQVNYPLVLGADYKLDVSDTFVSFRSNQS